MNRPCHRKRTGTPGSESDKAWLTIVPYCARKQGPLLLPSAMSKPHAPIEPAQTPVEDAQFEIIEAPDDAKPNMVAQYQRTDVGKTDGTRSDQLQVFRPTGHSDANLKLRPKRTSSGNTGALPVIAALLISAAFGAGLFQALHTLNSDTTGAAPTAAGNAAAPVRPVSTEKTGSIGPARHASGFTLNDTRFSVTERTGRHVLIVAGNIQNTGTTAGAIPDLTLHMEINGVSRPVEIKRGETLEPGAQLRFKRLVPLEDGAQYGESRLTFRE